MRKRGSTLIVLLTLALIVTACGDDEEDPAADEAAPAGAGPAEPDRPGGSGAQNPAAAKPEPKPEPEGAAIKLAPSQFGDVVFDQDDQAIYLFDRETTGASECYDECAAEWPPVLTEGQPRAIAGIRRRLLGTTKRDDHTTQVTYNGHPLYYYAHEAPGEVRCHNIPGFGGIWLALDAAGNPAPT